MWSRKLQHYSLAIMLDGWLDKPYPIDRLVASALIQVPAKIWNRKAVDEESIMLMTDL